jgi:hypothetical protein
VYSLISTIGIEFECEKILQNQLSELINSNFHLTHDASVESDVSMRENGMFIFSSANGSLLSSTGKTTVGTEIVTVPFDTESKKLLPELKSLTHILVELGEPEKSLRAGIHIHVNMSYNLSILKRILEVGMFMEDVFFLIATQGYIFRGMKVNESAYCRPITSFGPQCVRTNRGTAQIFNVKDLMNSSTVEDFWMRYGNTKPETAQAQRYVPQRYTWLNLYSLLAHGTLEFRVFNKTLSPFKLMAEVELCQKFCEYVLKTGFSPQASTLSIHSVYDCRTREEILETFETFADDIDLSPQSKKIISSIILNSPVVFLPQRYIWTHLDNSRNMSWEGSYIPPTIDESQIADAHIVDIHTLRGERRRN